MSDYIHIFGSMKCENRLQLHLQLEVFVLVFIRPLYANNAYVFFVFTPVRLIEVKNVGQED
jgi:hypothetical protein